MMARQESRDHAPGSLRDDRPLVALTMGDVAGVGPEIIAKAWFKGPLRTIARPVIIGSASVLRRALKTVGGDARVQVIRDPGEATPTAALIPCIEATREDLEQVRPGKVDARAGAAAHDFLIAAADLAIAGKIDALTTLPLNKESLNAAGVKHPGHTEILAERCNVPHHAMMLYIGPPAGGEAGLGVVHVTLHVPLRRVFELLTIEAVEEKILLANNVFAPLVLGRAPRIVVAGLNPHAGENGLFGDEEARIIGPAVERARRLGLDVTGPIAADTLFARALGGEFDAVIAMYHDQGHVALKTVGFQNAVNVTLGLPIIRTSVAHGTAYDIAWTGQADISSLIEAVRVAARLSEGRREAAPNR
jgi:4-hydroxythreonine-4-phosphate dehydrogenase